MVGRIALTVLLLLVGGGVQALSIMPLAYGVYLVFLWVVQCHLLFPTVALQPPEGSPPEDCKISWVDSNDGSAASEAWYFENNRKVKGPTLVIFHGNGEYISAYVGIARWFVNLGYNVLLPEYRGYGKSTGTPTEAGIVSDVCRHLSELTSEPMFDIGQLVFFGVSVGGGVASSVSTVHTPLALITQSTFYSIPKMSADFAVPEFIARILLCNIYDNSANMKRLVEKHDVPIMLAHGTQDTIVPYAHAELLATELSLPIYTRNCDHNDFYFDMDYKEKLVEFLKPFTPEPLRAASP